jgi:hypothetical protein
MIAATSVSLALAFVAYLSAPPNDAIGIALRATARWSFILFWSASVGGALVTLFGTRFKSLSTRARELGLSFASAHLVHLALVVRLYYVAATTPFRRSTIVIFGIAVFWTYLLALLSVPRISGKLTPRMLRIIRIVGVEYISFAFFFDFAKRMVQDGMMHPIYLPFVALAAAGPLLRFLAAINRTGALRAAAGMNHQ